MPETKGPKKDQKKTKAAPKKKTKAKAKKKATSNKVGRPSKLVKWLEAFEALVLGKDPVTNNPSQAALILTDEELVLATNDMLPEKDQIGARTFQTWKAGGNKLSPEEQHAYDEFRRLYKKALIIEKSHLFKKLQKTTDQWQKYAWIIERKFSDWNLRLKAEHTHKGGVMININKTYDKQLNGRTGNKAK